MQAEPIRPVPLVLRQMLNQQVLLANIRHAEASGEVGGWPCWMRWFAHCALWFGPQGFREESLCSPLKASGARWPRGFFP